MQVEKLNTQTARRMGQVPRGTVRIENRSKAPDALVFRVFEDVLSRGLARGATAFIPRTTVRATASSGYRRAGYYKPGVYIHERARHLVRVTFPDQWEAFSWPSISLGLVGAAYYLARQFYAVTVHEFTHLSDSLIGANFARADSGSRRPAHDTRPEEIRANAAEAQYSYNPAILDDLAAWFYDAHADETRRMQPYVKD